jgi:hypothetical protein
MDYKEDSYESDFPFYFKNFNIDKIFGHLMTLDYEDDKHFKVNNDDVYEVLSQYKDKNTIFKRVEGVILLPYCGIDCVMIGLQTKGELFGKIWPSGHLEIILFSLGFGITTIKVANIHKILESLDPPS